MLTNENNWTFPEPIPEPIEPTPEPIPKSTPKKRGVLFLNPEDMQEAKKSMKEKGTKAEDVKNLPPIEEIHGLNIPPVEQTHRLDNPTQVVKVNYLYRYDKVEIPSTKFHSLCLGEFDDFMDRQANFNDYVVRVATRTGRMTQEPLYPEGHPKRVEQDSQRNNLEAPSSSKNKKRKMIGLCMLLVNLM